VVKGAETQEQLEYLTLWNAMKFGLHIQASFACRRRRKPADGSTSGPYSPVSIYELVIGPNSLGKPTVAQGQIEHVKAKFF
jgi:hypothetical protein